MDAEGPQTQRDRETLAMLIDGDAVGLERLLVDHGGLVRAYLSKHFHYVLRDWQLEEVMALAMIRVWESAPRLELDRSTLRAWFAAVAHNRAVTLVALQRGAEPTPLDDIAPAALGFAISRSDALRLQLVIDVERCLQELDNLARSVLLRDLDAGATLPAALHAQRLGRSVADIEAARSRGRHQLRRMLQELGYFADESVTRRPPTPDPDPNPTDPRA